MDQNSHPIPSRKVPAAPDTKKAGPPPPPPPRVPSAAWGETTQVEGLPEVTSKVTWEAVHAGQVIAGLTLKEQLVGSSGSPVWTVWKAQDANGITAAVYALDPEINDKQHHRFVHGAKSMLRITKSGTVPGVLKCFGLSRDRRALIAQYLSVGRATDISALGWSLQRSITFFQQVCTTLDAVHQLGQVHGCLRPGNILLDDDFNPVLTEIGFLDIAKSLKGDQDNTHGYGAYAAPEVTAGTDPNVRSDIYSLGRILLFLLNNEHPKSTAESVPTLADYQRFPEGLVRIARRCTLVHSELRYQSIAELIKDLSQYHQADTVGVALRAVADAKPASTAREVKDTDTSATAEMAEEAAFGMSDTAKIAVVAAGLTGIALTMALAYFLPANTVVHLVLSAAASLSAAVCALALPASPRHRRFGFIAVTLAAGLLVFHLSPVTWVATAGAKRRLGASDVKARADALRFLTAQGHRDFSNRDFRGADLSGADLNFANLQNTDLTNANLTRSMVQGIKLTKATITGANLSDVVTVDWDVSTMRGFEHSRCSNGTLLPVGWRCINSKPVHKAIEAQGK
jgi:hypothetical protein